MARDHADAPFDPNVLWTVGRAADRARVTHAELIGWVREGRLEAKGVWRDGVEIRVVRAGDVAELAPVAREPETEPAGQAEPRSVPQSDPQSDPLAEASPDGALPPEPAAPSLAEEVDRLRARVERLRAPRPERPGAARPRGGAFGAALAGLALGGLGGLFYVHDPFDLFQRDAGTAAPPAGPAQETHASVGPQTPVEIASTSVVPVGPPLGDAESPSKADPADVLPAPKELRAASGGTATAASQPTLPASAPTRAPTSSEPFRPPAPTGRRWLANIDPTSAQAADHPPCAYFDLVRDPEAIGAIVLGPCIGAYAPGVSPPGTHRVEGVSCCGHHAFVERMTRASRDPRALDAVRAQAEAALGEEVVPPLLLMRAERSATLFLRDFVGHWVDAGLGRAIEVGGDRPRHAWSFPAGLDGRDGETIALPMRLESWVKLREGDAPERFVLELTLSDGARGDSRDAFRWIDAGVVEADDEGGG